MYGVHIKDKVMKLSPPGTTSTGRKWIFNTMEWGILENYCKVRTAHFQEHYILHSLLPSD